eukprot:1072069-Prymnesium_polylepis.1
MMSCLQSLCHGERMRTGSGPGAGGNGNAQFRDRIPPGEWSLETGSKAVSCASELLWRVGCCGV